MVKTSTASGHRSSGAEFNTAVASSYEQPRPAEERLRIIERSIRWRVANRIFNGISKLAPPGSTLQNNLKHFASRSASLVLRVIRPPLPIDTRRESQRFVPKFEIIFKESPRTHQLMGWEPESGASSLNLLPRRPVTVRITPTNSELVSFKVYVGTHGRRNQCTLMLKIFEIEESEKQLVYSNSIPCENIPDNQPLQLITEVARLAVGRAHLLELSSPDSGPGNLIALWGSWASNTEPNDSEHSDTTNFVRQDFTSLACCHPDHYVQFIPKYYVLSSPIGSSRNRFGWEGSDLTQRALPLRGEAQITASFLCHCDTISEIQILLGTYSRRNTGTIELALYTGHGATRSTLPLRRSVISLEDLADNSFAQFQFLEIQDCANKTFSFTLSSSCGSENNCVGVWGTDIKKHSSIYANIVDRFEQKFFAIDCSYQDFDEIACRSLHAHNFPIHPKIIVILDDSSLALSESLAQQLQSKLSITLRTTLAPHVLNFPHLLDGIDAILFCGCPGSESSAELVRLAKRCLIPVAAVLPIGFSRSSLPIELDEREAVSRRDIARSQQTYQSFLSLADLTIALEQNEIACICLDEESKESAWLSLAQGLKISWQNLRTLRLPKFSLVSVLYGKEREIPFFLEALRRQNYPGEVEVLFVDDQSPDRSSAIAKDFFSKLPKPAPHAPRFTFKLLENTQNIGNCGSRNRAIREASGDIIVVIDADCLINQNFFQEHANAHALGDADVSVGWFNLETNNRTPLEALKSLESNPRRVFSEAQLQDSVNQTSFLNCITRNFTIRREFITEDLFDELFSYSKNPSSGFGWEDIEMGYRLYRRGARIKFAPKTFSVHVSHPPAVEERTKPLRSQLNFRRLVEKHPEIAFVARRWVTDTYQKICAWADGYNLPRNEDRDFLDSRLNHFRPELSRNITKQPINILSYRWHCAHQYELYKLPYQFNLVTGLGPGLTQGWNFRDRPFPANARFIGSAVDERNFDLAILHFDENSLAPVNTNGVLESNWGASFKWFKENLNIPMIAICHGTPQFWGQYNPAYKSQNLGQPIEEERKRMVDFLGDTLVITNSHQAESEWGFKNSKVIWQGFDPSEFPISTYSKPILSLGVKMRERPYYRGLEVFERAFENFPAEWMSRPNQVPDPSFEYPQNTNDWASVKYRKYIDDLRQYSIYFNPTLRSPMPRSRGEAMMAGLVTVSANNHDVEMFIKNGWNGFYSNDPLELREFMLFLLKNPTSLREMGKRSRQVAIDIFNHDRYLHAWETTIREVLGR